MRLVSRVGFSDFVVLHGELPFPPGGLYRLPDTPENARDFQTIDVFRCSAVRVKECEKKKKKKKKKEKKKRVIIFC